MAGVHFQIVGARMLRPRTGVTLKRHRIETPDGDFLDLDFARVGSVNVESTSRLVLVLHGLEGSAESKYALETYRQLAGLNVAAVGLNFRSCGGEMNRNPRLYHSGETEDPRFALLELAKRYPHHRLGAIGFSLGGNVLLKYLGENQYIPSNLSCAAAVSVPFDLSAGADYLEQGLGRFYRRRLVRSLRAKILAKADLVGGMVDLEKVERAVTFREFDDVATAPLHGFSGVDDYYAQSNCRQFLTRISTPTLLIHADDDPFLPPWSVPRQEVGENDFLHSIFTDRGGHVGFLQGRISSPEFWAEKMVSAFVASKMK
jgi:predicted alpha/beta-fold hydrolase